MRSGEAMKAPINFAKPSEKAIMNAQHTLETTMNGLEEVARRHGWSEEVNCSPWTWLDNEIARLREPMTVEQLMSVAAKEDVLVVAGHVFTDRYLSAALPCLRCGRTAMSSTVMFREPCDGPALTTERLIAALHGEEGESSDE